MQNKSAIWAFTVLLILACVYQLSFTFVANGVEDDARERAEQRLDSLRQDQPELSAIELDKALQRFETQELLKMDNQEVYPVFGFTYAYCKRQKVNLGLDLQGGMNVTLQVNVRDLIRVMSDNSTDPAFIAALDYADELQLSRQDDYVTLFEEAWNEKNPNGSLAAIFHNRENKEKFALDATNEEILNIIRTEAMDAVGRTEQVLRRRIDNMGVVQPTIQRTPGTGRIIVELPGIKDPERVRKIIVGTAKLEFWNTYDNTEIYPILAEANTMLAERLKLGKTEVMAEDTSAIIKVEESAPDSNEATGDLVMEDDTNETGGLDLDEDASADLELSASEAKAQNPLLSLLTPALNQQEGAEGYYMAQGPVVGYAPKRDTAQINEYLARRDVRALFPRRIKFFWSAKPYDTDGQYVMLYAIDVDNKEEKAPLEGDVITNARVVSNSLGSPEISLSMNAEGAKIWKNMTAAAANKTPKGHIAIVLDGFVYSAPRVDQEIAGGGSTIQGQFELQEAEDLSSVLKAGKLPARSRIIEEAVVGPTLGAEAIQSGFMSFVLALIIVLVYMALYYNTAGVVADLALLVNLFFIMGVLSSIHATLTLPGIAGIVLTIGMSVDANVLIYERIREELRAGKGVRLAIVDGYKNAYSSIIDANITTLLTGIILWIFGSGPIQGFATTLIIGILTSLFAAIFITRLIFEWRMDSKATPSFSTKLTENLMNNTAIKFVEKRKMFYLISGAIIVLGLGSLAVRGLNYGVDFTGGRSYIVRFDRVIPVAEISSAASSEFIAEDGQRVSAEVKTFQASNQVKITTKYLINDNSQEAEQMVEDRLLAGLSSLDANATIESSRLVGPTIADDIKQGAVWAVLFSLIVIFLYIVIRFRRWQFGLGALIAMFHDVLIVLSLFSILYGFMPFSLEIDQAFIAAILTVVGYSINDTVVVFDRIREYLGIHKRQDYNSVINDALNSTLSRTLNTSLSTLVVLLMIFIFGGEVIQGFVFALIIGIIVGTYSSLCVATPIVVDFHKEKKG